MIYRNRIAYSFLSMLMLSAVILSLIGAWTVLRQGDQASAQLAASPKAKVAHGAKAWHDAQPAIKGDGIKVGIIDTGFAGYSSYSLASNTEARCYSPNFSRFTDRISDCSTYGGDHYPYRFSN